MSPTEGIGRLMTALVEVIALLLAVLAEQLLLVEVAASFPPAVGTPR